MSILLDTVNDPRRAAMVGAATGALKGVLVGAVVGKVLLFTALGAAGGAAFGAGASWLRKTYLVPAPVRAIPPSPAGPRG